MAGGVEVGHAVLGADWLHPGHRAATVSVAAHTDVVIPRLRHTTVHLGGRAPDLYVNNLKINNLKNK